MGVYCAFLIQQYAAKEKTLKEKEKITSAIKYELEFFRVVMPGRASYSNTQASKWREIYNEGRYIDFSGWRFIEPQYNYQVIQHAFSIQDTDIISFELNKSLHQVYQQAKRVEHIERIMTQLGFRYQSIPGDANSDAIDYQIIWNRNYDDFRRLYRAMMERSEDLSFLAQEAASSLDIVNAELKPSSKKQIEEDLIIEYVDDLVTNEEQAVVAVGQAFPDFTEEEIRIMYRKATGTYEEEVPAESAKE
ncbi:hypothetical protein [Ekhidna sp.]